MKIYYSFYLILLFSISFSNFSYDLSPAQTQIDNAIYELYNFRFEESLSFLDEATKLDDSHPLIPFLTTTVLWQQVQINEGYEKSYNQLRKSFLDSFKRYNTLMNLYPDNPEYYLYLGSSYGLLARIELGYGHWFKVLFPTLKGYKLIIKSWEMDSNLHDAYTPMGMSIYYTCMSQPFIKFCSNVMGLDMDCSESINFLEYGSNESYYSWIEANNILSYIYIYMNRDYIKGLDKSSILVEHFPDHPFFAFLEADALVRLGRWNDYFLKRPNLVDFANHKSKIVATECQHKLDYLDAYQSFYDSRDGQPFPNLNNSLSLTTKIIDTYSMEFEWLLGLTYLLRAQIYIEIQDYTKAKADLEVVSTMKFKFPEIDEAKSLLKLISRKK